MEQDPAELGWERRSFQGAAFEVLMTWREWESGVRVGRRVLASWGPVFCQVAWGLEVLPGYVGDWLLPCSERDLGVYVGGRILVS